MNLTEKQISAEYMYQGKIIERGLTSEVLKNPQEEYTKELINICS